MQRKLRIGDSCDAYIGAPQAILRTNLSDENGAYLLLVSLGRRSSLRNPGLFDRRIAPPSFSQRAIQRLISLGQNAPRAGLF